MNDALVTVVGNVAAEPRYLVTKKGTQLLSLRLASTPRRFDRESAQWRDGDTMFLTVTCWRTLAANAQEALEKGDPIIVTGRLRLREYDKDGERRMSVEIDATTLGHDLSRGVSRFDRAHRSTATTDDDRRAAARLADVWETTGSGALDHGAGTSDGEPAATAPGDAEGTEQSEDGQDDGHEPPAIRAVA